MRDPHASMHGTLDPQHPLCRPSSAEGTRTRAMLCSFRYETPKRTDINQKGIFPEVTKECAKKAAEAVACIAPDLKQLL
jgi:hypothetical protein